MHLSVTICVSYTIYARFGVSKMLVERKLFILTLSVVCAEFETFQPTRDKSTSTFNMNQSVEKCNENVPHGTVLTTTCMDGNELPLVDCGGTSDRNCKRKAVDSVAETVYLPRERVDCSKEVALALCTPFQSTLLTDIQGMLVALRSPLCSAILVDRYIRSCSSMKSNTFFNSEPGREAVEFVDAFCGFEGRSNELKTVASERAVLCAITSITSVLWGKLAALVNMTPVLTYTYGTKHIHDECIYLDSFLALKGQFKADICELHTAVTELQHWVRVSPRQYGTHIAYLPVYAAAGWMVEFGLVDVRTHEYFTVSRCDISTREGRVSCFAAAINVFRLFRTMAPYIPQDVETEE